VNDIAPTETDQTRGEPRPALGHDGSAIAPRHVYLIDG